MDKKTALNIVLEDVNSSQIEKIGYSEGILIVQFKGGTRYIYIGVNDLTYMNMLGSKSIGSFFSRHIKCDTGIRCVKLPD